MLPPVLTGLNSEAYKILTHKLHLMIPVCSLFHSITVNYLQSHPFQALRYFFLYGLYRQEYEHLQ